MNFCPESLTLLTPLTDGSKLRFKSDKTGAIYEGNDSHTLLAGEGTGDINSTSKYKNTLSTSAYNPINCRERLENGCPKCQRKVLTLQRIGAKKKVVYSCLCGNQIET